MLVAYFSSSAALMYVLFSSRAVINIERRGKGVNECDFQHAYQDQEYRLPLRLAHDELARQGRGYHAGCVSLVMASTSQVRCRTRADAVIPSWHCAELGPKNVPPDKKLSALDSEDFFAQPVDIVGRETEAYRRRCGPGYAPLQREVLVLAQYEGLSLGGSGTER